MSSPSSQPEVPPEGVRAPSAGTGVGCCPVCGVPLTGRADQETCSPRCRAQRHRQRQAERLGARDERLRALLTEALRLLGEGRSP